MEMLDQNRVVLFPVSGTVAAGLLPDTDIPILVFSSEKLEDENGQVIPATREGNNQTAIVKGEGVVLAVPNLSAVKNIEIAVAAIREILETQDKMVN